MKKAKVGIIAIIAFGTFAIAGCGGKNEVKPQPAVAIPAEASPTAVPTVAAPTTAPEVQKYPVVKGDTLWGIAGKKNVYDDNFQWPLIFKANRDQIQDPDIIEIGQDFTISHEFSSNEVSTAIENAKKTPRYVHHTKPRKHLPIEY